ncbi:MAG: ABC transporter substrate-binding protein [Pseudomonadota bacterium]
MTHLLEKWIVAIALITAPLAIQASDYSRTVVAGGSITEVVYALEAEEHLVAVDRTSLHPPEALQLENIGYVRRLSAEPILSVNPSLLLVEPDAGPQTALDQISSAGVEIIKVNDDISVEGVLKKIKTVGTALDRDAEADALIAKLSQSVADVLERVKAQPKSPRVIFLLSIGQGAPLAAGRDTSATSIIELAGGTNPLLGFESYKPASPEAIIAADPEFILVTRRTAGFLGGAEEILSRPEIAITEAGKQGNIIVMDGLLLLGFGPRIDTAIMELASQLHDNLSE